MNIFIAEKENHVREALRLVLEYQANVSIIGEASNAEILLAKACQLHPDVILMDWELPGLHPQRLLTALRQCCPATTIIATSVKPEHEKVVQDYSLDGFLSKQLSPENFTSSLLKIIVDKTI